MSETSGAVLDLNGTTMTNTNALTLNGTGIRGGGALINSSTTAGTYAGLITLGSASSIVATNGNITLSNTGTITGAGLGLTLGGAANGSVASAIGTTTGSLTKTGTGTWSLNGANTYTGGTNVQNGTLVLGTGGSLAVTNVLTLGNLATSGIFQLGDATGPVSTTVTSLAATGSVRATRWSAATRPTPP